MKVVSRETLVNKALKLLSYRPRSQAELRFRLLKLTDNKKLIDEVLSELEDQELIDDDQFTQWWVEQRSNFRPRGNIGLKSELIKKGINQEIIENHLLSAEQEKDLAKKVITKLKLTNKKQIFNRLPSRGFSYQTIMAVVDELDAKR